MSDFLPDNSNGLILKRKWEDLAKYVFSVILRNMPKSERFTLGSDMRSLLWDVDEALVQLAIRYGNRWTLLNLVDVKAKIFMSMIRLGIEIGAIPAKRYETVSAKLVEIGKIVGGLKKSR